MAFGREPILAAAVNVLLGVLALWSAYAMARELGATRSVARTAVVLVGATPTVFIYSFIPVRDPLITVLTSIGLLYFIRWRRSGSAMQLATVFFALGAAGAIHSGVAVLLVSVAGLAALHVLWPPAGAARPSSMSRLILFVGVLSVVLGSGVLLQKIGGSWNALVTVQGIEAISLKDDSDQRTAYVSREEARVQNLVGLGRALPRRVMLFLLSPFPWQVRAAEDLVGLIVALQSALATLIVVREWRVLRTHSDARALVYVVAAFVLVFAWGTVNYGSATRHKTKMAPIVAALCVVLIQQRARRRALAVGARAHA
jgi:4-amino-4-deoxy-L-arabinose transferase-like glycosyltransferase